MSTKRLDDIYRYAHWPPSTDYVAKDFLRYNSKSYRIHINSLGFRGPEVLLHKSKRTFRILAYGSYMTFGEGVDDEQTYLRQAQFIVNRDLKNKKAEILNGGMETGTFIMGLSRLRHELDITNSDAVLFEYGFVDGYEVLHDKVPDNYNTLIGHPELEPSLSQNVWQRAKSKLYLLYGNIESYLYKSKTYTAFKEKVLNYTGEAFAVGYSELSRALTITSKELASKGKRVFIVVNPVLPREARQALTTAASESGAILVDGRQFFIDNPPTDQMLHNFDNDPNNFLRETGFERLDVNWSKGLDLKIYAPYFQNLFQLSTLGHRVMGQALAKSIELSLVGKFNKSKK